MSIVLPVAEPVWSPIASAVDAPMWTRTIDQRMAALFASNEQGAWYDIDPAYCYQDAAGTVPAVVGQPVGLVLDRSKGLWLGPELVTNGDFSANVDGWSAYSTIAGGTISWDDGAVLVSNNGGTYARALQAIPGLTIGRTYKCRTKIVSATNNSRVRVATSSNAESGSVFNGAITAGASDVEFMFVATATTLYFALIVESNLATASSTFTGISVRELPGNHASQTTATSRPILRQNATTGAHYLEFDGSDDWLVTNSIDFTSTDKMTVWAGVRKLSDAAAGVVVENSTSSGYFALKAPRVAAPSFGWFSGGTVIGDNASISPYPAPFSAVLAGIASIAEDKLDARVNGGTWHTDSDDQGSGNYGNSALYIGRRPAGGQHFAGHLYGLTIRGAQSTEAQIKLVERYLAKKTGVTLA